MSQLQLALVLQLSHDAFHESRLTLAVSANKGNLVATLHSKVHAAEYLLAVESHGHVTHLNGVGSTSRTWREFKS